MWKSNCGWCGLFQTNRVENDQSSRFWKVEGVKTGSDGYVCHVMIAYKDTSDDSMQDWFS